MRKQNVCRERICKWAKQDLSCIGHWDDKVVTSLAIFCFNVYTGIKQVYNKDVKIIILDWASANLPKEVTCSIQSALSDKEKVESYLSPITDLLADGKFPKLPNTLLYNDYIPMEELLNKLQETFQ